MNIIQNNTLYIEPDYELCQSIDALNRPKTWSDNFLWNTSNKVDGSSGQNQLIETILSLDCVCICGEPGCGKSRLIKEIAGKSVCRVQTFTEIASDKKKFDDSCDIIILDALDEISEFLIVKALKEIASLRDKGKKVYFSCRKHYIERFAENFNSIQTLCYVKLLPFDETRINRYISSNVSNEIQRNNLKGLRNTNETVRKICSTPRYLEYLVAYAEGSSADSLKDGSVLERIFDYVIERDFETELKKGEDGKNLDLKYVVRSVLEKIALLMSIRRTDSLTKSELYATLDNIQGSFITILFAEYGISTFISHFFKTTGDLVQFHNAEIKDFLAAKAICNMDTPEYVLYDLAVHVEFQSFYPNWIDVCRHICYINPEILVNVFPLINREKGVSSSLIDLLKYINLDRISEQSKACLFKEVYVFYQVNAIYVSHSSALQFLKNSFVSYLNEELLGIIDAHSEELIKDNSFRIANEMSVIGELHESNKIQNENLINKWLTYADELVTYHKVPLVVNSAFDFWNRTKAYDKIHSFVVGDTGFRTLPVKLQHSFFNHISYCGYEDDAYVNLLINKAFGEHENCYAVAGCMHLQDVEYIKTVFDNLFFSEENFRRFIDPHGSLVVLHSLLANQLKILLETNDEDARKYYILFFRFAVKFNHYFYSTDYDWISSLIHDAFTHYGMTIVAEWMNENDNEFDLADFLAHIDKTVFSEEFVDSVLDIMDEERFLYSRNYINSILLRKIEDNGSKIPKNFQKIAREKEKLNQRLEKENQKRQAKEKKELVCLLKSKTRNNQLKAIDVIINNDQFKLLKQTTTSKLVKNVLVSELRKIDLDKYKIIRDGDSYSFYNVNPLVVFNWFKCLYDLSPDLLHEFRIMIAKLIPCQWMLNDDALIGKITSETFENLLEVEKGNVIDWWHKRTDDYMNVRSGTIVKLSAIAHTNAFIHVLESKVELYVDDPCLEKRLDALDAIDAFANGLGTHDKQYYEKIIGQISFNDETSDFWYKVNGILISKFLDEKALNRRIERLKIPVTFDINRNGPYALSKDESELNRPTRFDCLFTCKQPSWIHLFIDLIKYAIEKAKEADNLCPYAKMIFNQSAKYILNQNREDDIRLIIDLVNSCKSEKVKFLLLPSLQNITNVFLTNSKQESIQRSLRKLNDVQTKSYAGAQNEFELICLVRRAIESVNSIIEDEGYYYEMNNPVLEEQIQKSAKIMLEKELLKLGISDVTVIREAELYDKKRIDLLIKCAFLPPVIVELKRLHNNEIQNKKMMKAYKTKFIQYYNATHACYSWYWVFKVKSEEKNNLEDKFYEMKDYYQDISAKVDFVLTDCCEYARIHQPEKLQLMLKESNEK